MSDHPRLRPDPGRSDDQDPDVNDQLDVLVVTGGHPFEAEPFFAVFDDLPGIRWSGATAPEAGHDVVVFYDLPGLRFTRAIRRRS